MEPRQPGEDNPGYLNEEVDLHMIGNDNELKGSSSNGGHVTVVADGDAVSQTPGPPAGGEKNTHYPDGKTINHNNDQDLVLQKKEFDLANQNLYERAIMLLQNSICQFAKANEVYIWRGIGIAALLGFLAYFIYAMYYRFGDEGSIRLLVCTIFGFFLFGINRLDSHIAPVTAKVSEFLNNKKYDRNRKFIRWALYIVNLIVTVTLIIVVVALDTPQNLLSLAGLAAFIVICVVTSHSPAMINWHPVFWGFSIQFYFAIIILKTRWGYETFNWLGDRITEFLNYSTAGAQPTIVI